MTTLTTFLNLLDEFLNELNDTFPEELTKKLKSFRTKIDAMKKSNPRKVLELFMANAQECSRYIVNKDENLLNENYEFINNLGLKQMWTSERCTQNTKDAIWSHLNTLFVFGSTITAIPSDLLSNIEKVAEQCASGFENNSNSQDMLMGMQQLLANQMNLKH